MIRSFPLVIAVLALLTGSAAKAQQCDPNDIRVQYPPLAARYESAFQETFGSFEPGAGIGVLIDGSSLWTSARGLANADPENSSEMTPDHSFRIASITKTLVAALIHQLDQEQKLDLDDPLEKWEPGYFDGAGISIRDLVGHTSGIPDFLSPPTSTWFYNLATLRPVEMREVVDEVAALDLDFEPGSRFGYSNTNYLFLGLVIERVTGTPWHQELRSRILEPLGLGNTFTEGPEEIPGPLARGYFGPGDITHRIHLNGFSDGDVVSTTADLVCWITQLFNGAVLDDEHLEQMSNGLGLYYYGWHTELGPAYFHDGWWLGHLSSLMYFPESGVALAGFVNSETPVPNVSGALWEFGSVVLPVPEPSQPLTLVTTLAALACLQSCRRRISRTPRA